MLALFGANAGWIVSALILTAIGVALIEKRYKVAAIWCGAATVLTLIGLLHSYRVEGNVIREFFIWQGWGQTATAAIAEVGETTAAAMLPAETQPATAVTQASPATFTYRAFPLAVGYGLATIVFALAAYGSRRRAEAALLPEEPLAPLVSAPPPKREELPSIPLIGEEPEEPSGEQEEQAE